VAAHLDQECELPVGQVDRLVRPDDGVAVGVDAEVSELEDRASFAPGPAEDRAHAGDQLGHDEGLDDVVVASRVVGGEDVLDGRGRGEEEQGNVVGALQPAGDRDPVGTVAEAHVDESDVRFEVRCGAFDPGSVGLGVNLEARAGEGG
jgi:hypothetical protein